MYTLLLMLALVLIVGVVRGQTNLNDFQGCFGSSIELGGNFWAGGALSCPSGSLGMNITLGPASYGQNFTFCTTGGQPAPQFGGVFGFDLNTSTCLNPNPFTGDCSCSTAASYSPVVTTVNMVNYTFCIGVSGYGFAGLYFVEYIDGVATCTSPNPLNGSCGCPDGYSAVGDFGMFRGTFNLCGIDCPSAVSAATCNSAPYCSICQSTESPSFPFACSYSAYNEACCVSGNGQVAMMCDQSGQICVVNETGASCVCPESQMCNSVIPRCCGAGQSCCSNEFYNEFMCCDGQCCQGGTYSANCCSGNTTCCSWSDPDNPNHQFSGCCTSTEVCSQNAGCIPA